MWRGLIYNFYMVVCCCLPSARWRAPERDFSALHGALDADNPSPTPDRSIPDREASTHADPCRTPAYHQRRPQAPAGDDAARTAPLKQKLDPQRSMEDLEAEKLRLQQLYAIDSRLEDDHDNCCPTCLEPYDDENPAIVAACGHAFHLPCIYEWLERSRTCPVCSRAMSFEELNIGD